MNYVGQAYGFQVFEDDNVLTLKYPTGKKDGNKLGRRRRNFLVPGVTFYTYGKLIIVHPKLKNDIKSLKEY